MKIFKYQKDTNGRDFEIGVPFFVKLGGDVVKFGIQGTTLTIWATNEWAEERDEQFLIIGTGWDDVYAYSHVETIFVGQYVWHLLKRN